MYVVYEDKVIDNAMKVYHALEKYGIICNVAYSCKTNNAKEVISMINRIGIVPEVTSVGEFYECIHSDFVIINGVAWSDMELLAKSVEVGHMVNFNSLEQMQRALPLVDKKYKFRKIGIRVNFNDESRFGVREKDFDNAVKYANKMGFTVGSVHCHMAGCRPRRKYKKKVDHVIDLILRTGIRPCVIDFGGGMYSELPKEIADQFDDVCGFDDYAKIISDGLARLDYKPIVVVELGTALIANAVDIVAKVIDVDEYGHVVLDITKYAFGNMKPIPKVRDRFDGACAPRTLYGCSCMEDDVIARDFVSRELRIGEVVRFENCGAYTYSLCPDFIVDKGEVVVK